VSGDYLWDKSGPRDQEIARLERVLGTLRQQEPPRPLHLPGPGRRPRASYMAAVLMVAAAIVTALVGFEWWSRRQVEPGLAVTRLTGTPTIASRPVADRRELPIGHWLETDANASASIDMGAVGRVDVDPRTRVSLLSTHPGDYRLQLQRGTLHAVIWAPPGQFFVETPSATALDLGCAYTLSIDDDGAGLVRVTSGWVGFEWKGREAFIPAGAMCLTRPGRGPGTPHYEDTSEAFRAALDVIDTPDEVHHSSSARVAALDRVLAEVRDRDVVTLWHLLSRVDPSERDRVFDRLAGFVPPPAGVTRDAVREGRRDALDLWWDRLGLGTTTWWRTWKQQWRDHPSSQRER
jgi:hypothetical protein